MSQFPDDGNGDMLQAMHDSGMDLTKSLDLDFYLVFPDRAKFTRLVQFGHGFQRFFRFGAVRKYQVKIEIQ